MKLFEIEESKHERSGKTCRTCKHRERWDCGTKVFQYCGILKSNRTDNGQKKIKCKDDACLSYDEVVNT